MDSWDQDTKMFSGEDSHTRRSPRYSPRSQLKPVKKKVNIDIDLNPKKKTSPFQPKSKMLESMKEQKKKAAEARKAENEKLQSLLGSID